MVLVNLLRVIWGISYLVGQCIFILTQDIYTMNATHFVNYSYIISYRIMA